MICRVHRDYFPLLPTTASNLRVGSRYSNVGALGTKRHSEYIVFET